MNVLKNLATGSCLLLLLSCGSYKADRIFSFSQKPDETNSSEVIGGGPSTPETALQEAKIPTEAQKSLKDFLALTDEEALHGLKVGEEQTKLVCDRFTDPQKQNIVIKAFCNPANPVRPKSLVELQAALKVNITAGQTANGQQGATGFVLQGHSSSLVGRFVSAINPRVVLFNDPLNNPNAAKPDAVALGFVRGEQLSEIAAKNPDGSFDFFIVAFEQACNSQPSGCSPADLLTPAVESNWTSFTLYQDEDLKNSIVDCRQCHQPEGPNTVKLLRMQELVNPWTHWFRSNTASNALIVDYQAAHGTAEVYGGIPGNLIRASQPPRIEDFVRAEGFVDPAATVSGRGGAQPNQFDTTRIASELAGGNQAVPPANCKLVGTSKSMTWNMAFSNFMNHDSACDPNAGRPGVKPYKNAIPPPYHSLKVTEPTLLAKFTKQYQDFAAGTITNAQFEDHRDVLITDQKELSEAGFAVDPALAPADILKLACSQCHHSDLDQSLSRAKFNAMDFSKMANLNAELDVAISRVKLGYSPERLKAEGIRIMAPNGAPVAMHKAEHLLTMPPRRFRQLTDVQIDALVKYFESQKK